MARLKVTQVRSDIGRKQNQRDSLRSLGLKRINDVVVKEDRPESLGMIFAVSSLVVVGEVGYGQACPTPSARALAQHPQLPAELV